MKTRYCFANVWLTLPVGWIDVTDDLPDGTPPTLGRTNKAFGALQISSAKHVQGGNPSIDRHVLQSLLRDFEVHHGFPHGSEIHEYQNKSHATFGVYADHMRAEKFVRVWYVSDGNNAALVTFVTVPPNSADVLQELIEADEIVHSISFN